MSCFLINAEYMKDKSNMYIQALDLGSTMCILDLKIPVEEWLDVIGYYKTDTTMTPTTT